MPFSLTFTSHKTWKAFDLYILKCKMQYFLTFKNKNDLSKKIIKWTTVIWTKRP